MKFPRIIKLKLATRQQKSEMFGRRAELNKIRGYEKVFFANDMSEEELLTYREVKQIHNAAAALDGVESKIRNDAVIIDHKVYKKHDFTHLPHGLLESVSAKVTPDGLACQGHNSPLSNLFACALKDDKGRTANSVCRNIEGPLRHSLSV